MPTRSVTKRTATRDVASSRIAAKTYIRNGLLPIPIPLGEKAPNAPGWPNLRITAETVENHFDESPQNVGVLLGAGDNPIADVDCDSPEAIVAAGHMLPKTNAVFGRASKLRSHFLFRTSTAVQTKRFEDPVSKGTLIELRGKGAQTIVPPSINPSGEPVSWDAFDDFPEKVPSLPEVDASALLDRVGAIAGTSLLARYWPKAGEGRHFAMLALAGTLAKAEWMETDAFRLCDALYRSIDQPDLTKLDRTRSEVKSTFEKRSAEENITGTTTLKKYIDSKVVDTAFQWMGVLEPLRDLGVPERPEIQLKDTTLDEKVRACEKVITDSNHPPTLFIQGNALVRVVRKAGKHSVEEMGETELTWHLAQRATFLSGEKKTDPSSKTSQTLLLSLAASRDIPCLDGIVSTPVLREDGSVLDIPGYDPVSRLQYCPAKALSMPPIPHNPTSDQVNDALATILKVIAEFPFDDESSRANALAAILTPIVRPCITGATPLALFDATAPGTGKSLLADIVSIIAMGTRGAMMTVPGNREELRKKITSVLRQGSSVVILDNVSKRLDSDDLMSVLSATVWEDRLLGQSKLIALPVRCAWIATANNIQLEGQMVRRSYWIRMDAQIARPHLRSFKQTDLPGHVKNNRGPILAAILTLGRAWFVAGSPKPNVKPLGSYESWATVVGGILQFAGISGFLGNADKLHEQSDDETAQWEALLSQLFEEFNGKSFTTGQLVSRMDGSPDLKDTVEVIYGEAAANESQLKHRVTKDFKARLKKRFGLDQGQQYWLEHDGTLHKVARWVVRSNQAPKVSRKPNSAASGRTS